jgi:hypothetical protein
MNISISIPDEVATQLAKRAEASGQPLPAFVSQLVTTFTGPSTPIEQLSGEIGRRFIESGISEEELSEDLERAKHEMRAERRKRNGS